MNLSLRGGGASLGCHLVIYSKSMMNFIKIVDITKMIVYNTYIVKKKSSTSHLNSIEEKGYRHCVL